MLLAYSNVNGFVVKSVNVSVPSVSTSFNDVNVKLAVNVGYTVELNVIVLLDHNVDVLVPVNEISVSLNVYVLVSTVKSVDCVVVVPNVSPVGIVISLNGNCNESTSVCLSVGY